MLMKYLLLLFLFYVNYAFAKSTFHSPDHSKEDDDSKLGNEILKTRKLSPGYVRGRQILTHSGVEGFAFLSIPMAEAPIGQLRFKRPLPRKPWEGVYDATDYKVSCYWNSTITSVFTSAYNMSEDCIHAHVFTNKYCLIKGDCAVAMYIHGGEFAFGSPLQFNPEFLVDNFNNVTRNVVLVTIGFRAAVFGTLNLNWKLKLSSDLNPAFHDIVHALEWIQSEIHAFGGDNNRVTVMGHSGGAVLVDYLTMSPYAQNLFNQAVIMSKSGDIGNIVPDRNQAASRRLANKVGCTNMGLDDEDWENQEAVEAIVQCLRNKSPLELSAQQPLGEKDGKYFAAPALDYGKHALLPSIYPVLDKGRRNIPVLTGTVSKEWLDARDTVINAFEVDQEKLRYWCKRLIGERGYNVSESAILLCMKEYNTTSKSIYIFDDATMYAPQLVLTKSFASQSSEVYLYQFEYDGIGDAYFAGSGLPQPAKEAYPGHSHELIYLLGQHLGNFTAKDYQIKYIFSQIFVNFINHGSPNSKERKWKKFNPKDTNYFVIDFPDPTLESPGMRDGYHHDAHEFWDKALPLVAGEKHIPITENQSRMIINGVEGLEDPELRYMFSTTSPLIPDLSPLNPLNGKPTNWQLLFWIVFGVMLILAIALCCTCVIAKKRRNNYETL